MNLCNFCTALINQDKVINWHVRSTYADDNIDEVLDSYEESCEFKFSSYVHEDNVYVGVEYKQEISLNNREENAIIWPFSETIQFNYCPICGKQISKKVKQFESYYDNQISIEER